MPTYTPTAREAMVDVATAAKAAGWSASQTEASLCAVAAPSLVGSVADVVAEVYGSCPRCGRYPAGLAFETTPNFQRCSLGHVFPAAGR